MKAKRRYILILIVLIIMLVYRILTTEDFLLSLRYPIFGLWSYLDISCYKQTSTKDSLPIFNETKGIYLIFLIYIRFNEIDIFKSWVKSLYSLQGVEVLKYVKPAPRFSLV